MCSHGSRGEPLIASLRYATEYKRQRQEQAAVMHVIGTPEGMAYGD